MEREQKKQLFQKRKVVVIGAMISTILWGSAFPCIKVGYQIFEVGAGDSASQILFAGIRFFLAGILTVIFGSLISKRLLIPTKASLPKIGALALAQTIGQYIFFYVGLARTSAVNGSIISGCTGLFVIIGACLIFRYEKMTASKALGCVLAVAGLVVVNLSGLMAGAGLHLVGDTWMMISAVSSATSSILVKVFSGKEDPIMLSGYQFAFGGFVMMMVGVVFGGHLARPSVGGILLLIYMALISSVAYTVWSVLIKYNNVSRISAFSFLIPVIGTILSAVVLGADSGLGVMTLVALVFVSTGIFFINHVKKYDKIKAY
ncbi:DMT family transporter [Eubacterium oxidoreducens]|uniref:Permease of the drug/metabolite transporter (DMT) superfamily n=1 Tax=Eubacterium oxidoreducens TaxID=1732 RepID=A0A1G6A6P7_EUBOX|nr:DMT family transporter [Eubacterium oxidoreducens]SDB04074.1 Permease of the drug/metabolite transporter (DMT) superfamily [Eubacterium oxidoreducens]